ncbi:MAG: protein kinase [Planctomycetes bacterium]|nr:protein kinase [Planctomycetota bacterium]MBL7043311.1 protein kinase [Pirellulaceae bacterium]
MSVPISEFWKLAIKSRLLTAEQCEQLYTSFGQVKGADTCGNARTLTEWLISKNALTRYQTRILLSGRSGPFFFGDYKIYDSIKQGPFAGMFRAVHTPTSHPVVLQFLTGPDVESPGLWTGLEARLQRQVGTQYPHLYRCFEVVDSGTFKFLVIESLGGISVEDTISAAEPLAPQEACRIARCAALGLAELHQMKAVHGDVRPRHLWIENGGNVRLLRDPVGAPAPVVLTQPDADGTLLARADYLAPEFLQHGKKPDALTDIYALGCSLYELLAGRPPFPGGDVHQKINRHANQPIQPLEQMGIPQPIAQLVTYVTAKNPSVRYQRVAQVAEQLTPLVDPDRLNVQPPAPAATLAVYERSIQQNQTLTATTEDYALPALFLTR